MIGCQEIMWWVFREEKKYIESFLGPRICITEIKTKYIHVEGTREMIAKVYFCLYVSIVRIGYEDYGIEDDVVTGV